MGNIRFNAGETRKTESMEREQRLEVALKGGGGWKRIIAAPLLVRFFVSAQPSHFGKTAAVVA